MQDKWTEIRNNLENLLDPGIFRIWVAPLSAQVNDAEILVFAPNEFMREWVKKRLDADIRKAASMVINVPAENIFLQFSINRDRKDDNRVAATSDIAARTLQNTAKTSQIPLPVQSKSFNDISQWHFKFEDFVVGPANKIAVAAAKDISSNGNVRTLFVNAAPGLGKTHLVQAAGHALVNSGAVKAAYLTAEQFASRFVAGMRSHNLEEFKQYLCSLDALVLEDVHFLQRKKVMQEMILGVIKNLQSKGARVIFTSSFAPRDLQDMDSQLVSHLCSGIMTPMDKPNLEMRKEILQRKAKTFQVKLPEDVCDVLSRHLSSDVRQLESCLQNMVFKARLLNSGLNMDLAIETINQYATSELVVDINSIIRLVCESFGITEKQLCSKSRRQEYVNGRNTAFYLARKHTDMSLEEIGCIFKRRHSTVMRGITQVEQEIARESQAGMQFARAVSMIERKCGLSA